MRSVRTGIQPRTEVFDRELRPIRRTAPRSWVVFLRMESLVLDLVYVLGVIVLFAVVALVAKGVEKL